MKDQLGVAVIGTGYWGVNYVRIFDELSTTRVAAVCDLSEERLNKLGRHYPDIALKTSLEETLSMPEVDAAIVCTGATTHFAVAQHCLEAGKHILIEKPMATTSDDAAKLIDQANSRNVTLMVGHTFLYNPAVRMVKEYLDRDDMGEIYYLYSRRTNLGPIRHDVNALWDLAPHDVSIFNYLLDSTPAWVSAVGARVLKNGHEDVGFITLGYEGKTVGNVHVSWADPNKVRELVVVGSNRRIVFDDTQVLERVKIYEKGVAPKEAEPATYGEFLVSDGDITIPRILNSEPLKNQCSHFVAAVTEGRQPLTDGAAGLAVVKIMEAIDRSLEQNGVPVRVDEEPSLERELASNQTRPSVQAAYASYA